VAVDKINFIFYFCGSATYLPQSAAATRCGTLSLLYGDLTFPYAGN
jgi:hypothetical protein